MIIIFTGPLLSGKGTQAKLLGEKLGLPVFSIGQLLRENVKEGYDKYAMQGRNLPTELKFELLREKMEGAKDGFILENFPATKEDLDIFVDYLSVHGLAVDKVFHLTVSEEEMKKRMIKRGRIDDKEEIVEKRMKIQNEDREPVLEYFRSQGIVDDLDGNESIEATYKEVVKRLSQEKI